MMISNSCSSRRSGRSKSKLLEERNRVTKLKLEDRKLLKKKKSSCYYRIISTRTREEEEEEEKTTTKKEEERNGSFVGGGKESSSSSAKTYRNHHNHHQQQQFLLLNDQQLPRQQQQQRDEKLLKCSSNNDSQQLRLTRLNTRALKSMLRGRARRQRESVVIEELRLLLPSLQYSGDSSGLHKMVMVKKVRPLRKEDVLKLCISYFKLKSFLEQQCNLLGERLPSQILNNEVMLSTTTTFNNQYSHYEGELLSIAMGEGFILIFTIETNMILYSSSGCLVSIGVQSTELIGTYLQDWIVQDDYFNLIKQLNVTKATTPSNISSSSKRIFNLRFKYGQNQHHIGNDTIFELIGKIFHRGVTTMTTGQQDYNLFVGLILPRQQQQQQQYYTNCYNPVDTTENQHQSVVSPQQHRSLDNIRCHHPGDFAYPGLVWSSEQIFTIFLSPDLRKASCIETACQNTIARFTGFTLYESVGLSCFYMIHPMDSNRFLTSAKILTTSGECVEEFRCLRKNGGYVHVLTHSLTVDNYGRPSILNPVGIICRNYVINVYSGRGNVLSELRQPAEITNSRMMGQQQQQQQEQDGDVVSVIDDDDVVPPDDEMDVLDAYLQLHSNTIIMESNHAFIVHTD